MPGPSRAPAHHLASQPRPFSCIPGQARYKYVRNGGVRKSANVFDPNYDFDSHFGRAGKQPKGRAGKAPGVGTGRKNPNDVRSRPKKG